MIPKLPLKKSHQSQWEFFIGEFINIFFYEHLLFSYSYIIREGQSITYDQFLYSFNERFIMPGFSDLVKMLLLHSGKKCFFLTIDEINKANELKNLLSNERLLLEWDRSDCNFFLVCSSLDSSDLHSFKTESGRSFHVSLKHIKFIFHGFCRSLIYRPLLRMPMIWLVFLKVMSLKRLLLNSSLSAMVTPDPWNIFMK